MGLMFLVLEHQSDQWLKYATESTSNTSLILIAIVVVIALTLDALLPIHTGIISVFSASALGFTYGAIAIWFGLMGSCIFAYYLGASAKSFLFRRWLSEAELKQVNKLTKQISLGSLVALRGVPLLAETSVIAAGIVGYPLGRLIIVTGLANMGLACAYAYIGDQTSAQNSPIIMLIASLTLPVLAWSAHYLWRLKYR